MNKLITVLIAGLFSSAAFAQMPSVSTKSEATLKAEAIQLDANKQSVKAEAKVDAKADASVAAAQAKAAEQYAAAKARGAAVTDRTNAVNASTSVMIGTSVDLAAAKTSAVAVGLKGDDNIAKAKVSASADRAASEAHTSAVKAWGDANVKAAKNE